jgi:hypothetical protein
VRDAVAWIGELMITSSASEHGKAGRPIKIADVRVFGSGRMKREKCPFHIWLSHLSGQLVDLPVVV